MYLTVELLKKREACREQVDLFAATFPDGVEITEAVCLSVADMFDFEWAAARLFTAGAWANYLAGRARIQEEYRAKRASIQAEYGAKLAASLEDYLSGRVRILEECRTECTPIRAEYQRQRAAAIWAEHKNQLAALFGRIASTMEG